VYFYFCSFISYFLHPPRYRVPPAPALYNTTVCRPSISLSFFSTTPTFSYPAARLTGEATAALKARIAAADTPNAPPRLNAPKSPQIGSYPTLAFILRSDSLSPSVPSHPPVAPLPTDFAIAAPHHPRPTPLGLRRPHKIVFYFHIFFALQFPPFIFPQKR